MSETLAKYNGKEVVLQETLELKPPKAVYHAGHPTPKHHDTSNLNQSKE